MSTVLPSDLVTIAIQRHETVQLEDGESFFEWAANRYPRERFTVELDPWELRSDN